jgi:hypothetical protein
MSVIGGPNILEDGLVLYLDAGSGKSFRGEPTTNLANTDTSRTFIKHSPAAYGNDSVMSEAPEKGIGWKKITVLNRGNNFRIAQFPYIIHPTNTTRTYSVEIDFGNTTGYYIRGDGFIGFGNNSGVNGRYVATVTTTTGNGALALFLNNNITGLSGLNDVIYYRNYQVEDKPYATSFTEGVRGTTVATGGGWIDISRNDNHGQLVNGPIYNGSNLGSLVFDGVDDYISKLNIELNSTISLVNNFTIEQIFKPTAYQPSTYFGLTNMLLNKGPASTYNYATQITNDTMFSFVKRSSGEGLRFHGFTVPNMLNKINVITLVIQNGDNPSIGTVSCYYNGEFVSTISISGLPITANNNDPFYIGGHGAVSNTMFIGQYFSAKLYNKALSSNEVLQNYNALKRRYGL